MTRSKISEQYQSCRILGCTLFFFLFFLSLYLLIRYLCIQWVLNLRPYSSLNLECHLTQSSLVFSFSLSIIISLQKNLPSVQSKIQSMLIIERSKQMSKVIILIILSILWSLAPPPPSLSHTQTPVGACEFAWTSKGACSHAHTLSEII